MSFFYNPPNPEVFYKDEDYTLNEGDHGNVVTFNSATTVSCFVPDGLRIGFTCTIIQEGLGKVQFIGDNGQINDGSTQAETKSNWGWAKVLCIAPDKYAIDYGGAGGGAGGSFILSSQFGTRFSMAVDEELNNLGNPTGTGSLTITKI